MNFQPKRDRAIAIVILRDSATPSSQSNLDERERRRRSRLKFNLTCLLIAASASLSFAGIGLFWSGLISENAVLATVQIFQVLLASWGRLMAGEDSELE